MSNKKMRRVSFRRPETDARIEKSFQDIVNEMGPDKPSPLLKDPKFMNCDLEFAKKLKLYFESAVEANTEQIGVLQVMNKMYERDLMEVDKRIAAIKESNERNPNNQESKESHAEGHKNNESVCPNDSSLVQDKHIQ